MTLVVVLVWLAGITQLAAGSGTPAPTNVTVIHLPTTAAPAAPYSPLSSQAITGISIGVAAAVLVAVFIAAQVYMYVYRKKQLNLRQQQQQDNSEATDEDGQRLEPQCADRATGERNDTQNLPLSRVTPPSRPVAQQSATANTVEPALRRPSTSTQRQSRTRGREDPHRASNLAKGSPPRFSTETRTSLVPVANTAHVSTPVPSPMPPRPGMATSEVTAAVDHLAAALQNTRPTSSSLAIAADSTLNDMQFDFTLPESSPPSATPATEVVAAVAEVADDGAPAAVDVVASDDDTTGEDEEENMVAQRAAIRDHFELD